MVKDRKLWVVVALALALLVATSPASFGAASFGLKVVGYTTSANVVYVTVANPTQATQSGTVVVSAVVNGMSTSGSAPFTAAARSTVVVPVVFSASPSGILHCGATTDDPSPMVL